MYDAFKIMELSIQMLETSVFLKQTLLLCHHFIMTSQTEKPPNKMKDRYEKIMRARYRKRNRKLQCEIGNSTTNMSASFNKKASKIDVLTEELFLTKKSEKQLKKENSNLKNVLKKYTENSRLREENFMKLKKEQDMKDSQIQTSQAEIAHLKQLIKDKTKMQNNEHELATKIKDYQKDIAHLTKIIDKQKAGKFNPNEIKIKQLNIKLRQQRLVARNLSIELETCRKLLKEQKTEKSEKQNNGDSA